MEAIVFLGCLFFPFPTIFLTSYLNKLGKMVTLDLPIIELV